MTKTSQSSKSLLFAALIITALWFVSCRQVHAQVFTNGNSIVTVSNGAIVGFQLVTPPVEVITFSNGQPILTNGVVAPAATTNAVSFELAPVVHLLFGDSSWVAKILAWLAALTAALAPFRTMIRHTIADRFNAYATASSTEDDEYLRKLFSSNWYRLTSFILCFIGVTLPTLSDLERAIAQQHEAVVESKNPPPAPSKV